MFAELVDGVWARYEPSNELVYLLIDNELRTLAPGTEAYDLSRQRLHARGWSHDFPSVPLNVQIQIMNRPGFAGGRVK